MRPRDKSAVLKGLAKNRHSHAIYRQLPAQLLWPCLLNYRHFIVFQHQKLHHQDHSRIEQYCFLRGMSRALRPKRQTAYRLSQEAQLRLCPCASLGILRCCLDDGSAQTTSKTDHAAAHAAAREYGSSRSRVSANERPLSENIYASMDSFGYFAFYMQKKT